MADAPDLSLFHSTNLENRVKALESGYNTISSFQNNNIPKSNDTSWHTTNFNIPNFSSHKAIYVVVSVHGALGNSELIKIDDLRLISSYFVNDYWDNYNLGRILINYSGACSVTGKTRDFSFDYEVKLLD